MAESQDLNESRIMLGLLDAVERDGGQSQRRLATELGIALGLVNAYLKRCTKKGLIKVRQAPARRYAYYLTPQGFAEKSRLTIEYLTHSLTFFRQAKADCSTLFRLAQTKGIKRVVFAGQSDLAEIAALCAIEYDVQIVAVVQPSSAVDRFVGYPVFWSFEAVNAPFDAVIVTDLSNPRETCEAAISRVGSERVFAPDLLRLRISRSEEARQ